MFRIEAPGVAEPSLAGGALLLGAAPGTHSAGATSL